MRGMIPWVVQGSTTRPPGLIHQTMRGSFSEVPVARKYVSNGCAYGPCDFSIKFKLAILPILSILPFLPILTIVRSIFDHIELRDIRKLSKSTPTMLFSFKNSCRTKLFFNIFVSTLKISHQSGFNYLEIQEDFRKPKRYKSSRWHLLLKKAVQEEVKLPV